ncbi:MAG TPA: cell surface protein SprA, partial [Ignavibacteriaceae bacterium]|nr:cell surface protein SprA [Ignavibacteriaceae bacterium]
MFYAGINLGFGSGYESQVNEAMLQAACFEFLSSQQSFELPNQLSPIQQSTVPDKQKENLSVLFNDYSYPDSPIVAIDDSVLFIKEDSIHIAADSLHLTDSTKISDPFSKNIKVNEDSLRLFKMSLDSTARLQYFRYQREDLPYTTLAQKKKSKFFVEPSPTYKTRKVTIDSTGKYVEIQDIIAGKPSKIILRVPLEEYIAARLELEERKKWEALGYAYELKESKVGLSELIKSFTDFEIPLPSVGVLSIFGTPKISLKIGGAVQIHGAWRNETTEGVTASRLGNTRNEPDFKQQVQINVNGTIGDKLNISADWNTERTFEYENQLKIKYTGYEDEIIQSIEAGNVSLQTSPLVGGSEALFGIKAHFKMGPFTLTTIASQKKGETKEVQVSGGTSETSFQKRAYDYSTNHFFLDTIYASQTLKIFENYYGKPNPEIRSDMLVTDIQVWKSINIMTPNKANERNANVFIDLRDVGVGEVYPQNYRNDLSNPTPGKTDASRFTLLSEGVDYVVHRETGFITLKTAINENDIIAVAFRRENGPGPNDDRVYGEFLVPGSTDTTRLVLK